MDLIPQHFLSGLLAIIVIDLVLAGDNAIVIALAARNLPRRLQYRAIAWGTLGAVVVRIAMTLAVVLLLRIPGLMLIGSALLLPIAWNLLREEHADHKVRSATSFIAAMRTIVVADALMGLDNVLAIAGASHGNMLLVVVGLLISVPLVVWGSTLILRLLTRFPIIVYIGAGAIAWTSARMISHDHLLVHWFARHAWVGYVLDITFVILVCGLGWLRNRKHPPHPDH